MQARASCPGTNQVINPVDMFILKRRTGGGDHSRCAPDNERQLAAHSFMIHPSPGQSLGLPCSLARNFGGRKDDLTTPQPAVCLCFVTSTVKFPGVSTQGLAQSAGA